MTAPGRDENGVGQSFWSMLNGQERDALRQISHSEIYEPGECIITQGETSGFLLIVQDGWVKITVATAGGATVILALRTVGELVGEGGSVGLPRTATVIALCEVRALRVVIHEFSEFLQHHPSADHALLRTISDRRIESDRKYADFGKVNSSRRLAQLLLDLADRSPHTENETGEAILNVPLPQEGFADLIGASTATVERILRNWRGRGIVGTSYRRIVLRDIPTLRRIAG